jgi:hypothetical protein
MPRIVLNVILCLLLWPCDSFGQSFALEKVLDSTHHCVVAVLRMDSAGSARVCASGVLVHPRVVLTAGHVNFGVVRQNPGGCAPEGYVALGDNAYESVERVPFNWMTDIVTHPDSGAFQQSFNDTTGRTKPNMYADVGLVFLNAPLSSNAIARLPDSTSLEKIDKSETLIGSGFGYHMSYDSTFTPGLVDGRKRMWRLQSFNLVNNLWLSAGCDTLTHQAFIGLYDSGGPLLAGHVVLGIWSMADRAPKPCPYASLALRVDNPAILRWIREQIRSRLGTTIE